MHRDKDVVRKRKAPFGIRLRADSSTAVVLSAITRRTILAQDDIGQGIAVKMATGIHCALRATPDECVRGYTSGDTNLVSFPTHLHRTQ